MAEFRDHLVRVLTVLPREPETSRRSYVGDSGPGADDAAASPTQALMIEAMNSA